MPFACASGLLQATSHASYAFSTAIDRALKNQFGERQEPVDLPLTRDSLLLPANNRS
jgi:hypothetical protein